MSKKILYVDDDPAWRTMVETALGEVGHDVRVAADATEAMRMADETELGVIILDLNLDGENGIALMKFLRHNLPQVPIILYTGLEHDEQAVVNMLQQGAHQYLRKGAMTDLISAVRRSFR